MVNLTLAWGIDTSRGCVLYASWLRGVLMGRTYRAAQSYPGLRKSLGKNGVTCNHCGFEYFKFKKACPRCLDRASYDMDTSHKDAISEQVRHK